MQIHVKLTRDEIIEEAKENLRTRFCNTSDTMEVSINDYEFGIKVNKVQLIKFYREAQKDLLNNLIKWHPELVNSTITELAESKLAVEKYFNC